MLGRKRKHGASPNPGDLDHRTLHPIQAYEADIRCSQTSARSLEASDPHIGEALIKHSTGGSEIWLDRYVRSTLPLQNPVCSVCSGTVADIHLIFTVGLSRSPPLPYLLILLHWRDPHSPTVRQIRCTPHLEFPIHLPRDRRAAVPIPIRVVRYSFGYRRHFLLLSGRSRRLPSR